MKRLSYIGKQGLILRIKTEELIKKDRLMGVSLSGMLGLIVAFSVIFYPVFQSNVRNTSIFHEIKYNPGDIVEPIIRDSILSIKSKLQALLGQKMYKDGKPAENKYNDSINELRDTLSTHLGIYTNYRHLCEYTPAADSAAFDMLNDALHFDITLDTIQHWDELYSKYPFKVTPPVHFAWSPYDLPVQIRGITRFTVFKDRSNMAFFSRNSSSGIWALCIAIFCAVCFMAGPVCLDYHQRINAADPALSKKLPRYTVLYFIILGVIGLLIALMSFTFYDAPPARNLYFLSTLWHSLVFVIVIGYLAGVGCFTGFVYAGYRLDQLYQLVEKTKDATMKNHLNAYQTVLQSFNGYFVLAAIILSLLVFCVGSLYDAINHLPFIRLLADDWGISPVPRHFIYLYGALHTILLLIFYLPTKLSFPTRLPAATPGVRPEDEGVTKNWSSGIKQVANKTGELLIASLPFLTGIMQSIIDILFGN